MNRQQVLECIRKELHDDFVEHGIHRPLGEVVPRVAKVIRDSTTTPRNTSPVMSVLQVAAFVDGDLSGEEEKAICEAIQSDNSVLAELIAAVRAIAEQSELPPLQPALLARLAALGPSAISSSPPSTSTPSVKETVDSIPSQESIDPTPSIRRSSPWLPLAASLALAASMLWVVWQGWLWTSNSNMSNPTEDQGTERQDIASDPSNAQPVNPGSSLDDGTDMLVPSSPDETPKLAGNDDATLAPDALRPETTPVEAPTNTAGPETIAGHDPFSPEESITSTEDLPITKSDSIALAERKTELRWTKVSGLMARQADSSSQNISNQRSPWAGIENGNSVWGDDRERSSQRFKTFTGSRAEGTLRSGGRIVLGPDTSMRWTRDPQNIQDVIDLEQGSFALVDHKKGSSFVLKSNGSPITKLDWDDLATVVVESGAAGLQIWVDDGTILIDHEPKRNTLLLYEQDRIINDVPKPTRLPTWVARSSEPLPLPKSILAQLSKSRDIDRTIQNILENPQSSNLGADEASIGQLLGWRAALVEADWMELLSSRRPALRVFAFQRLLQSPSWDPRWVSTWNKIEQELSNEPRRIALREALHAARKGATISAEQAGRLATMLESRIVTERVLADLLLRRFLGGGPVFDPIESPVEGQRNSGLWRRFINAKYGLR